MRILFFAKDYPPPGSGAARSSRLARALVTLGHDIVVVAREDAEAPADADDEGVRVLRAPEYPPLVADFDAFAWQLHFNLAAFERGAAAAGEQRFDVVHAEGWTVAHAAIALRRAFACPLVARLDPRIPADPSVASQIERWLAEEADAVVAGARGALERVGMARQDRAMVATTPARISGAYESAVAVARPARWRDDRALRALFERTPV